MSHETPDDLSATAPWPTLCCPQHGVPVTRSGDGLACPRGHDVPVRDDIPRFVGSGDYASAFGEQWLHYRLTQLDSHTGVPITEQRARRCLGEELWASLEGKQVLECGCGAGRFTEILLGRGARVTSVDLSQAVDANRQSCPVGPRHRVLQADIRHLPFAPRQFDVVFCLGVVQHTPDPEQTIACLYDQVKPAGSLVIDHYRGRLSWYTRTAPLFREVLKRLPPGRAIGWTERLVDALLPLHRAASKSLLAHALVTRLSPIAAYYRAYPELSPELQRQWALLDTHDLLTDWYKHFRTREQIAADLRRLGLREIWCENGGNGVEARGKRPPASG